ncbi:Uncharacterised protein [Mycobacterium tuberculosis]|nr:Uncharacterised protein [Mycobacterium tuberculosis]
MCSQPEFCTGWLTELNNPVLRSPELKKPVLMLPELK